MYLKYIDIQGFKSFPDKVRLTFGSGITAIVGPNGSGKSNISDAVRWVLGEQSTKTLRGAKMEDVIFGGTERRSPVGFSEVSLTIDNCEYLLPIEFAEVTITRRYYRSGESEYYINRRAVRLRDIHELFMDTGLGRDGYSIIGQGRIDEILSIKSDDRREVFEEAAGITKNRYRKEEAERKLAQTEENLVRIRDIVAELEAQVEPLKIQAEKAHRFLILRDELRELEIGVWLDSLLKLRERSQKLNLDFGSADFQLEECRRDIERMYAESETLSARAVEIETALERCRERQQSEQADIAALQNTRALHENDIRNNLQNIERLKTEAENESSRIAALSGQGDARRARIKILEDEKAQKLLENDEVHGLIFAAARSGTDLSAKLDGLRAERVLAFEELAKVREDISSRSSAKESLFERESSIEKEIVSLKTEYDNTVSAANELEARRRTAEENLESAQNSLSGFELRYKTREQRLVTAKERHHTLQMEDNALKSRSNLLSDMQKEYEGFSNSVKTVLQESARGRLKNIHGTVAILLSVPDKYTVSIETSLGGALQHIVVENEQDGKSAINLLKQMNAGRCTFLPISAISGQVLSESGLSDMPGFVGIASRLVSFAPKYKAIFENLLGRTVVAEHMDAAINIAKKFNYRFRIATLDGQLINAGGSMTGGSVAKSSGILTRANELSRLLERERALASELAAARETEEAAARELAATTYEIETAQGKKRFYQDELIAINSEKAQRDPLLSAMAERLSSFETQAAEIKARISAQENELFSLQKSSDEQNLKITSLDAEIAELSGGQEESSAHRGSLEERAGEIRVRLAEISAQIETESAAIAELEGFRENLSGGAAARLELISGLECKNAEMEQEIEQYTLKLTELAALADATATELSKILETRMELEARRGIRERDIRDKNERVQHLERERARLENLKSAAENEETGTCERLWENYELTLSEAEALKIEISDLSAAKTRINTLKTERKALGDVNISAIEEYKTVGERYDFLSGQLNDLETAKRELTSLIRELTSEMEKIFTEQFEIINANFGETFTEMFGGGRAELCLTEPSDILNCGIDIRVQPPGKALKTITLLSGGEKAFTAIALYFAILKIRPTPFCVLDEIEAALDDANVVRFANYLRKMSGRIQFIVITHRRGTMEEADILYGVTMQEQGVSKLLTMSLGEFERDKSFNIN